MEVLMLNVTRITRFVISGLAALAVAALLSTTVSAGTAPPKGNEGKGRYYFRQTCKDCHTKGAKGGEVTPLTKTQAQWRAYFLKAKHAGGAEPLSPSPKEDHHARYFDRSPEVYPDRRGGRCRRHADRLRTQAQHDRTAL